MAMDGDTLPGFKDPWQPESVPATNPVRAAATLPGFKDPFAGTSASPQPATTPASADTRISDYIKAPLAGVIEGVGSGIAGIGSLGKMVSPAHYVPDLAEARGASPAVQRAANVVQTIADAPQNALQWLGHKISAGGEAIAATESPGAKAAEAAPIVEGHLLRPSTWKLGPGATNPRALALKGLGLGGEILPMFVAPEAAGARALGLLGKGSEAATEAVGAIRAGRSLSEMSPEVAQAAQTILKRVSRVKRGAGAAAGGLQMGEGQAQGASAHIEQMPQADLAKLPPYQEAIAAGMTPEQARASIAERAHDATFAATLPLAVAQGLVSTLPLLHGTQGVLSRAVGTSRVARAATGAALEAPVQGGMFVGQNAAGIAASNAVTGEHRSPLEDSLATFGSGALMGGAFGLLGGAKGAPNEGGRTEPTAAPQEPSLGARAASADGTANTPQAGGKPTPEPDVEIPAAELRTRAQARLAELNTKAEGTPDQQVTGPDGKPVTVPGQPPAYLTGAERELRDWLNLNVDDPQALAARLGVKVAPEQGEKPAQTGKTVRIEPEPAPWVNTETGEITTPSDNQVLAVLHRLGDRWQAAKDAGDKPTLNTKQISQAWHLPTKQVGTLLNRMRVERRNGVTTADAQARAETEPTVAAPLSNPAETLRATGAAQSARLRDMQGTLERAADTIAGVRSRVDELNAARGGNAAPVGVPREAPSGERFDPQGLQPGTPEYDAAFEAWVNTRNDAARTSASDDRRAQNQEAVDTRNGWRRALADWFRKAADGESITDTGIGQRYVVRERTRKDGTKVKALVATDDAGNTLPEGRGATGINVIGGREGGLQDGALDPDLGVALPESSAQDTAATLGKLLLGGEATASGREATPPNVAEAGAAGRTAAVPTEPVPGSEEARPPTQPEPVAAGEPVAPSGPESVPAGRAEAEAAIPSSEPSKKHATTQTTANVGEKQGIEPELQGLADQNTLTARAPGTQTRTQIETLPDGTRRFRDRATGEVIGEIPPQKVETAAREAAAEPETPAPPQAARAAAGAPEQPVMQNRDRSRVASVAQMQQIAAHPDPLRLGFSRDPNSGAPMVSAADAERTIPKADRGDTDTVVMPTGRKIPVRYAVVEAGDVAASHNASGVENKAYANAGLRALNNGRTAGIQAAWEKGTAADYRAGLLDEAKRIGIDPAAIESKKRPMLIRVYDRALDQGDMGAESNAATGMGLSPSEQARTDARAIGDLTDIPVTENGALSNNPAHPFYRHFLKTLGPNESAKLMDAQGRPNKQFMDRVQAAIFAKAYGDDRLVTAMAEEAHPDARNVLNALTAAAPEIARIDKNAVLGDLGARLAAAVETMRAARESGQTVESFVNQGTLIQRNTTGDLLAAYFAKNARSVNRMAEAIREMARRIERVQQGARSGDIFGGAQPNSRQIIEAILHEAEQRNAQAQPKPTGALFNAAGRPSRESRTGAAASRDAGRQPAANERTETGASSGQAKAGLTERAEPAASSAERTTPEAPEPTAGAPKTGTSAIEDFGEKLGGARKDLTPSLDRTLSEADIARQPLSKIWPAAEVDAIEQPFARAVAYATRAEIPAKPRKGYKVKWWVEKVQAARELARLAVEGRLTPDELGGRVGLKDFAAKVKLLQAVDRDQWGRIGDVHELPNSYAYGPAGEKIARPHVGVTIDGRWNVFDGSKTLEEALPAIKERLGTAPAAKKMQFQIRGNTKAGKYFINKKGDSEYRHLKDFTDVAAARAYMKDHHDDLVRAWEAVKERDNVTKADMRNATNRERVGPDYRDGKDVTPESFADNFGFRGVEFGNWVRQGGNAKERQGLLNQAYDGLMDLANILGVPPRAMSLEGTLGLGLGSRGSGRASAHFEPDRLVINLTKTRGAGALAHEWFHALDNYFARKRGVPDLTSRRGAYVTYKPEPMMVNKRLPSMRMTRAELAGMHAAHPNSKMYDLGEWQVDPNHPPGVRPVVEKAFADLVKALNESPMRKRAASIDKGGEGYWSRIIERAARSFENYVIARMDAKGLTNDYLANVRKLEAFNRNPERYPYLRPEEVEPVAKAFDNLFQTVETRQDANGNVALFSRAASGEPTTGPLQLGKVVQAAKRANGGSLPRPQVQQLVDRVTAKWGANRPQVHVVDSAADFPAAAHRTTGFDLGNHAFYDGREIWLARSNLRSPQDVLKAMAHEPVHYALDRIIDEHVPGGMKKLTADIERLRNNPALGSKDLRSAINETERRYRNADGTPADAATFARELPAVLAERGVKNGILARVVQAIRVWLRRHIPGLDPTEKTIHELLAASGKYLRAAAGGRARGAPAPEGAFSETAQPFYSALTEAVNRAKGAPKSADATAWKQWLDGAQRRGEFKGAEREWMDLDGWLDAQKGPITREALLQHVRDNEVRVQEVLHADEVTPENARDIVEDEDGNFVLQGAEGERAGSTKFGEYTLPGGKNYRELLLTLPAENGLEKRDAALTALAQKMNARRGNSHENLFEAQASGALTKEETAELQRIESEYAKSPRSFKSGHFDEPNIIAHVRMDDRTGPDGEKILHVEEVQADKGQAWRKLKTLVDAGTATDSQRAEFEKLDKMPFNKTEQWSMLAMKRVLRYAAEHGYDKVTWTTGEQQADRYDLSHKVDAIRVRRNDKGGFAWDATRDGKVILSRTAADATALGDSLGKDLAAKADTLKPGESHDYTGSDLKVGGAGMRAFYDKMLPNEVAKYVKKWGAKVGETRFGIDANNKLLANDSPAHAAALGVDTVHSVDITPAMRESVMQGQPLFAAHPRVLTLDDPAIERRDALRDMPATRQPDALSSLSGKALRDQAKTAFDAARAAGPVHMMDGADVRFSRTGWREVNQHSADRRVLDIMPDIRDLMERAVPLWEDAVHDSAKPNLRAYRHYGVKVSGPDGDYYARFVVRVGKDGRYHYDHDAVSTSAIGSEGPTRQPIRQPKPGEDATSLAKNRLAQWWRSVNDEATRNPSEKPNSSFSRPEQGEPADPSKRPRASMDNLAHVLSEPDPGGALAKAKAWVAGKAADLRPAALGALQTSHVLELMDHSPPLKGGAKLYDRQMHQLDADRTQLMSGAPDAAKHPKDMLRKGAAPIADGWRKWAYQSGLAGWLGRLKPEAKALADVMHQATLQRMDPAKAYERLTIENAHGDAVPWTREAVRDRLKLLKELSMQRGGDPWADREKIADEKRYLRALPRMEAKRERDWPKLQDAYNALPAEAKTIYQQVRDWYSQHRDATEEALIKNIEAMDVPETYRRSLVNRMRLRFEEARREGVYFPLNRDGDYWIAFKDAEGNEGFKMFEQSRDAKRAEKRLRQAGYVVTSSGRRDLNAKAKDAPSGTFVRQVIDALQKANVSEKVQDEVYQTFLRSLPEMSLRKHSIHRKNIAGFSEDALRAFAKNGFHGAHQLARLRHAQDMAMTLDAMRMGLNNWRRGEDLGDESPRSVGETAKADALMTELQKRHDWIMSPTDQQLANMVNSLGFVWYLGASPASAITNLTQVAQTVLPVLGAQHGWDKATPQVSRAWWQAVRTGGNLEKVLTNADELHAYMEMQRRGDFSRTQAHTLAALAEGNILQTTPAWAKTMNAVSWMFHTAEVINRETAGMAAYRLARAKGLNHGKAVDYAGTINAGTNFDYSSANRPRYMQGNVQRIALQFKNYSVGMTWLFYRNLYQAMKGETPEARRVARRTVTGILGMTAILAGVTGLPMYSTVRMAANAANTLFGDPDEPFSFDDEFHAWLAENLGPDAARLIAAGPTSYVTGANLSDRTSLSNLWIRHSSARLEGADAYHALLENLAGPIGGVVNNFYVGSEDIRRGKVERGFERMLPTAAKNAIKSLRYAHEGVNSLRGDPIVPDVSTPEQFIQMLGFQPSRIAEQYRLNTAARNFTSEVGDRRSSLMNAYALAVKNGDGGDMGHALRNIAAYNRKYPQWPINGKVLRASLRQRARLSARAEHGVILNPRLAPMAREYAGITTQQ